MLPYSCLSMVTEPKEEGCKYVECSVLVSVECALQVAGNRDTLGVHGTHVAERISMATLARCNKEFEGAACIS